MAYLDGLIKYLVEIAVQILYGIFYPVVSIFKIFINVVNYIWGSLYDMVVSFYNLFTSLYTFINNLFSLIFPNTYVALILVGITIVFLFRVYHFVKDIELGGFKI